MRLFKKKAKSLAMKKYGKIVTAELDDDITIYLDRPNDIVIRRAGDILIVSEIPSKVWERIEKYLVWLAEGHKEYEYEDKYLKEFIAKHMSNVEKLK